MYINGLLPNFRYFFCTFYAWFATNFQGKFLACSINPKTDSLQLSYFKCIVFCHLMRFSIENHKIPKVSDRCFVTQNQPVAGILNHFFGPLKC